MTAATSGPARAEEYLRLLAETALRRRDATGLNAAAHALAHSGLLDAVRAADIVTGFETATAMRLPENAASELRPGVARRAAPFLALHRFGTWSRSPGTRRPPDPVTVTDVSTRLDYHDTDRAVDLYLFALVRTAQEACLSMAGHTQWRDPGDWAGHDTNAIYNDLAATDGAGNRYGLRFAGSGSDTWTYGRLCLAPVPPPDVRWLDVRVRDGAPTRVSLTGAGPAGGPGGVTCAVSTLPLSRPERYLEALAEAALATTGWRPALSNLAAATRALLATGGLPAGSGLPSQVAALCSRAGLPADGLPGPSPLPGHWSSVLDAYPFGDRDPYAGEFHPPPSVASLAISLPEIDGARIALTALVSRGKATELHGSFGMNMVADSLFSCWLRDDSSQWHAALPGGWESTSTRGTVMSHAILVPPVPRTARSAEIVISGATTQARATVPLAWWAP